MESDHDTSSPMYLPEYEPSNHKFLVIHVTDKDALITKKAEMFSPMYDNALRIRCSAYPSSSLQGYIGLKEFEDYANAKEVGLSSIFYDELDLDCHGHLHIQDLSIALRKAGITLLPKILTEFITALSSSSQSHALSFTDLRDLLLLLPPKASLAEIYQYYQAAKFMGDDGRGLANAKMEGNIFLNGGHKPLEEMVRVLDLGSSESKTSRLPHNSAHGEEKEEGAHREGDSGDTHHSLEEHSAIKFLLAGGTAGAMSRTCTAPFDRLKVFLITRPPDLGGVPLIAKPGIGTIGNAVARIYAEGGILAFWTGNGLSVAKIFPESAIKFFTYESSKRAFAKYWDEVEDPREISGVSRFLSGGIGGISSQLSIYPIETLKTQMMSNANSQKRTLSEAARHVWSLGGPRAYYRGLTIGLLGVFPYSAIDMSTFEALKLGYLKSTSKEEPGVLALLAFGSISGSVGATSVYPLNFIRTRLQASGSSGHPQEYTGVWDVAVKTWESGGWRGFYRGLFPTLAKVVPAVSISYVVYEHAKRKLGV